MPRVPLIVVPDDLPPEIALPPAIDRLKAMGEVKLYDARPASEQEFIERIKDADVVVNVRGWSKFTRQVLEQCPRLRMISVVGTGVDNVDLKAAADLGITVTNTPGVTRNQVAEHAIALMLCAARQLCQKDKAMREGQWARSRIQQIYGKTLGLVGTGVIGRRTGDLGRAIGMNIIAWTMHPTPEREKEYRFEFVASLNELLKRADVVSLHLRDTPDAKHIIGERELGLMKPTAILVNTARGPIIDEQALYKALAENKIAGAGLDVFEVEPLPAGSPLTKLDNVIMTPHNATTTLEAVLDCNAMTVDNVENFLKGQPTDTVVLGTR